ncbi:hypothetical protein RN04_06465 [Arthrobacter sp. W1]|nr:hypothetical protein RN04_06465 [Arthrobacter sp. W1]
MWIPFSFFKFTSEQAQITHVLSLAALCATCDTSYSTRLDPFGSPLIAKRFDHLRIPMRRIGSVRVATRVRSVFDDAAFLA